MIKTTIYENDDIVMFYTYDLITEEKDWFEENTSESRLAKYWASEEMATKIFEWYWHDEFGGDDLETIAKRMYAVFNNVFPDGKKCRKYLVQLLKKEWFR